MKNLWEQNWKKNLLKIDIDRKVHYVQGVNVVPLLFLFVCILSLKVSPMPPNNCLYQMIMHK